MMVYGELKSALTGAGIRFVPFKGAVLRETYPVPETRTMGDVDAVSYTHLDVYKRQQQPYRRLDRRR